jgi:hypothetical protein
MDPRDEPAMLGEPLRRFLGALLDRGASDESYKVHFVTAREMVNIALAACSGLAGEPGDFRDYRLKLVTPRRPAIGV